MSAGGRPIVVSAGGTGGHLFPAQALAEALAARGAAVELVTDERAAAYAAQFPARAVHAVPAATPSVSSPFARLGAAVKLGRGVLAARSLLKRIRPAVVVGFGGYPTVPPLLAASLLKIPVVLHEQNAVLGRANRFLARRAGIVATGFPTLAKAAPEVLSKQVHVGNPVRASVLEAAAVPYDAPLAGGQFRLLATGGSQGARIMSDVVPPAVTALPAELRARLHVVQQARPEDELRVKAAYAAAGVAAEVAPFFKDLPARIAAAHLVVGRAGASTVAELAVIGRPAVLVPLAISLDQDQLANAHVLAQAGGAEVVLQSAFNPEKLSAILTAAMSAPDKLAGEAAAARAIGIPDAAGRLADLVLAVARGERPAANGKAP